MTWPAESVGQGEGQAQAGRGHQGVTNDQDDDEVLENTGARRCKTERLCHEPSNERYATEGEGHASGCLHSTSHSIR